MPRAHRRRSGPSWRKTFRPALAGPLRVSSARMTGAVERISEGVMQGAHRLSGRSMPAVRRRAQGPHRDAGSRTRQARSRSGRSPGGLQMGVLETTADLMRPRKRRCGPPVSFFGTANLAWDFARLNANSCPSILLPLILGGFCWRPRQDSNLRPSA
jgi:hypothetical protein